MNRYTLLLAFLFSANFTGSLIAQDSLNTPTNLLRPEQQLRLDIVRFFGQTSLIVFGAATARYSPQGIPSLVEGNNPISLAEAQWGITANVGRVSVSMHLGSNSWELSAPQNPENRLASRAITKDFAWGYKVWDYQGFSITPCLLSSETWRALEHDRQKITYLNSLGGELHFTYAAPFHTLYIADKSIPEIQDVIEAAVSLRIGYARHFTSDNSGTLFAPFAIPAHQEFSVRIVAGIAFSVFFVGDR